MFEEQGMTTDAVIKRLQSMLEPDASYASGRPMASMSTAPHDLGVDVFSRAMEKNAGRFHTFSGSAEVERQVIRMVGDLFHLEQPLGTTTSGGTESNILAMLACRETAAKKTGTPEIIAPETVHASVDKAAWILGAKLVKTRVDSQFKADPSAIQRAINKKTIGIFATAGTTYLGQIDPIDEIATIASRHSIPFHVDAAFGGFVIPFLNDLGMGHHVFDFQIEGVTSISVDAHKMGLAPIPSGCVLFRSQKQLESITRRVPYLRGQSAVQHTLLGTRPAGSILAAWAVMKQMGRKGYRDLVSLCMKRTLLVKNRVEANRMLQLAIEPVMNIVGIECKELSLEHVTDRMEERGWRMATSPLPPSIRIVVMPHITEGTVNAFFNDLDEISTTIPAD